jgi:translation initiation factor IF-1
MSKDDVIQMLGEVIENLPNATFRVKLKMVMWFGVICVR